jgi:hypothetical protein
MTQKGDAIECQRHNYSNAKSLCTNIVYKENGREKISDFFSSIAQTPCEKKLYPSHENSGMAQAFRVSYFTASAASITPAPI